MISLAFLKAKLSGVMALVLAVLAGLVWHRQVVHSRDQWKARARQAEGAIEKHTRTVEREEATEEKWSDSVPVDVPIGVPPGPEIHQLTQEMWDQLSPEMKALSLHNAAEWEEWYEDATGRIRDHDERL
jgi:hypothetical protein